MSNFNKITLIGTLDSEVNEKTTTQGHAISTFNLKVKRPKGQLAQTDIEKHDVFAIVCWNELAQKSQTFSQNTLLLVEGRISTRTFDTQEGLRKWITEIDARNIIPFNDTETLSNDENSSLNDAFTTAKTDVALNEKVSEPNTENYTEEARKEPSFNFNDAPADIAKAISNAEENTEDVPF